MVLLDQTKMAALLPQNTIFRRITVCDELPSTNTALKEMAKNGAEEGTVLLAAHQTAGRGRLSRSFYSPKGGGLYLSLLLRPDIPPEDAPLFTPLAAVAGARAVAAVSGVTPSVKWVNDLLLGEKKLAGILCEAGLAPNGSRLSHVIIGIGINLHKMPFPQEIEDIATSIEAETGILCDGNALAAAFLAELESLLGGFASRAFLSDYRALCSTVGKRITVMADPPYTARAVGIDSRGGLVIEEEDGTEKTIQSGDVSVRT